MPTFRQPLLGIAATLVVLLISFGFIALFDGASFTGWVSYYLMCTIPASLVIGVFWGGRYPAFAAARRQPVRGVFLLLIALGVGAIVAAVQFVTVGGAINPPLPLLLHATVLSVVVAFVMTIIWGGWPFVLIRNPLAAGISLLVGYYAVSHLLFRAFFNYDFLTGTPLHHAELDPSGLFDGWSATAFTVTAGSVMFLMLHFDLWPLTRVPTVMRQPVLGLVWTGIVLVLAAIAFAVGTRVAGMAPPVFLTTVPIPFIFGSIVVLTMLGGSLFARFSQPVKGVCSALTAAVIGTALSLCYGALAPILTGPVQPGPPEFGFEVWLASALLAVAFPFLAFHADFFQMWPLAGGREQADQALTDRTVHQGEPT